MFGESANLRIAGIARHLLVQRIGHNLAMLAPLSSSVTLNRRAEEQSSDEACEILQG
jgi:hypothetical protein